MMKKKRENRFFPGEIAGWHKQLRHYLTVELNVILFSKFNIFHLKENYLKLPVTKMQ